MDLALWAEIRRLFHREKLRKKAIARRLEVDIKTVRRALALERVSEAIRRNRPSKLESFKERIRELLESYPELSAVRIQQEIVKEGYTGGVSILKEYLTGLRNKKREAFVRLAFAPAEAAQVDWGHCGKLQVEGVLRNLYVFVLVLCHSRMMYVVFTLTQAMDAFLQAHQQALHFIGGVPKKLIYDNLKSVVLARVGKTIRFNPHFLDFAAYYLFEPVPCRPARGNEKGRVERGVGYVKGNFLAGRSFYDLDDINRQARRWLDEVANVRTHGSTRKRPVDLFEQEKPLLGPLPEHLYQTDIVTTVKVTSDARVTFQTNTYSVPVRYIGERLLLRAGPSEVALYQGEALVARHKRSMARGADLVDERHIQSVVRSKQSSTSGAHLQRFLQLGPKAEAYVKGLVSHQLRMSLQLKQLVGLLDLYGRTEFEGALESALAHQAFGYEYVQHLLLEHRRRAHRDPEYPLVFAHKPELEAIHLPERDLEDYDRRLQPPQIEEK